MANAGDAAAVSAGGGSPPPPADAAAAASGESLRSAGGGCVESAADVPPWTMIIKVGYVEDKLHGSVKHLKRREELVPFQVQPGSRIFHLKQWLVSHARRPAEYIRLGGHQLEDRLIVGRDGAGTDCPWFRVDSGRKVVNMVGLIESSWHVGLSMGAH